MDAGLPIEIKYKIYEYYAARDSAGDIYDKRNMFFNRVDGNNRNYGPYQGNSSNN